jgi:hypothetical protein
VGSLFASQSYAVFGYEDLLIKSVGMRLPASQQQSANVERVCKAHKLIHTKARNRLHLPVVQMLLYVYVNLRLMNKISAEMGDGMGGFLVDTLSNFDEEDVVREEDLALGDEEHVAELMDLEEEARETARIRAENGDDEMRLAVDDDVDEDDQDPMRIDQHTAEVSTRVQDEPAAQQRKRKRKQKQKPVKKRASARTSKPSRRVREAAAIINSPCART